jgi:hypothetical protein
MNGHRLLVLLATTAAHASALSAGSESPTYLALLKLCAKINNTERCAQAIEASYANLSESRLFRRTGSTLEVLTPRKTFSLKNNENPDGDVSYHYLAYLARNGIHVVHLQYGEGNDFAVIGDQDDASHVVSGFPITSPDDRRFFSYNVAGEAQYTPDALEVWRIESGTLVKEFSTAPNFYNCHILSATWKSKDEISLTGKSIEESGTKSRCIFRYKYVARQWVAK